MHVRARQQWCALNRIIVSMADLETAKRALVEVLKDKTQRYWELMKNWYKRRVSGEEQDSL